MVVVPGPAGSGESSLPQDEISKLLAAKAKELGDQLAVLDDKLPDKYYTYFYLAQIEAGRQDYPAAIAHLSHATELGAGEEDMASIFTYLGVCHKEMGQYRDALAALRRADGIDPERTDTLNLMGCPAESQLCHRLCQPGRELSRPRRSNQSD